jgi:hypothetical protein
MAKISRNVKTLGSARDQSFARPGFSPAVESQAPVAVVIVQKPAKSPTPDLQAQVCIANGDGFRQRPQKLDDASLAVRAGRQAQASQRRRRSFSPIRAFRCARQRFEYVMDIYSQNPFAAQKFVPICTMGRKREGTWTQTDDR